MNKIFFLLCFVIGCLPAQPITRTLPPPETVDYDIINTVVGLVDPETGYAYCAGVLHENMVITAAHCVDGRADFDIGYKEHFDNFRWWKTYKFGAASVDQEHDVAVLVPKELIPRVRGALLGPNPKHGERVVVIGHPLGLGYTITTGVVSYPLREFENFNGESQIARTWTQISAPIAPGNSGGPVFNRYGEIIGIISFYRNGTEHLAGAVHIEAIKNILEGI